MGREFVISTWENFPGSGSKLTVLMAIAEAANQAGNTYLAMAEIAGAARVSKSAVEKAVRWLRAERWLVAAPIMGRGNLLAYQLNLPKLQRSVRPDCDPNKTLSDDVRAARKARERRSRKYGTPDIA